MNGSLVKENFGALDLDSRQSTFSLEVKYQLISFGLLLAVFYYCRKHACVGSHNSRIENKLNILMLMGWNFNVFRIDLERELLDSVRILLFYLKFNSTRHFIIILYFYLLDDTLRVFGRYKSSKVE